MKLVFRAFVLAAFLAVTASPAVAQWTVKLEQPTPLPVAAQEKKVVVEPPATRPPVVQERKTVIVEPGRPVVVKEKLLAPEPVALGTQYLYQVGNPYWYTPYVYYPTLYGTYSSPYPFGSVTPVFGLYSWDYGVYYPGTYKLYSSAAVTYPVVPVAAYYPTVTYPVVSWYSAYYPYYYPYVGVYPAVPGRYWLGFGW